MRHKEFIHGRSLFHFPKKCLLSEGLFFTSRCLKCVSRVSVKASQWLLFSEMMRRKEFIRGRSLLHSPKKCLVSEGLFFTSRCLKFVSRVSVRFKRINDYFSQKRWDTKNSFNEDPSSTLQKSILFQRVYSVSIVSSLSHCLTFCLIGSNFYISVSTFNIGANGIFSQSPRETEFGQ